MPEQLMTNDDHLRHRYEEMVAALKTLRRENHSLAKGSARTWAENHRLKEANFNLAEDNKRLRDRLSAHRKRLPKDVMPFGKYQGEKIAEVPTGYLEWVLAECGAAKADFRAAVYAELESRRQKSAALKPSKRSKVNDPA